MSGDNVEIFTKNFKGRRSIVVFANGNQIEEIKKLIGLKDSGVKRECDNLYSLCVTSKEVERVKILNEITLGDMKGKDALIKLLDFENSKEFYKKSRCKSGYKIVSDEFSNEINRELYNAFQTIEIKFRKYILSAYIEKGEKIPNSMHYRKELSDHAISVYELSDFFESFLYQPASDLYKKKTWNNCSKTEEDVIKISKLKQMDELGFCLDKGELEIIRKIRNQCMHFRVTTIGEYEEVAPILNKYLKNDGWAALVNLLSNQIPELNYFSNFMASVSKDIPMSSIENTNKLTEILMNIMKVDK